MCGLPDKAAREELPGSALLGLGWSCHAASGLFWRLRGCAFPQAGFARRLMVFVAVENPPPSWAHVNNTEMKHCNLG